MVNDVTTAVSAGGAAAPNAGTKQITIEVLQSTLATTTGVNPGDTFTFDLATYGGTKLWDVRGSVHTTLNSVIVPEVPTVSVSGTVITTTIAGGDSGGHLTLGSSKTRTYTYLYS